MPGSVTTPDRQDARIWRARAYSLSHSELCRHPGCRSMARLCIPLPTLRRAKWSAVLSIANLCHVCRRHVRCGSFCSPCCRRAGRRSHDRSHGLQSNRRPLRTARIDALQIVSVKRAARFYRNTTTEMPSVAFRMVVFGPSSGVHRRRRAPAIVESGIDSSDF